MTDIRLGRLPSPEEERAKYLSLFALTPETAPTTPTSVRIGINFYHSFFDPKIDKDGHAWIGKGKRWGRIDGGHAMIVPKKDAVLTRDLADYYNQGQKPQCVAYSNCLAATLDNDGQKYAPGWLYRRCQDQYDRIPGPPPPYDGTEVRAALECERVEGLVRAGEDAPHAEDGISVYRWATTIEAMHAAAGTDVNLGYFILFNTWGPGWGDHGTVRVPNEAMERLIFKEAGDAGIPTDR